MKTTQKMRLDWIKELEGSSAGLAYKQLSDDFDSIQEENDELKDEMVCIKNEYFRLKKKTGEQL
jgi:hypothetical protein